MKKLVLVGSGDFGREVAWIVERINKLQPTWDLIGFVDDDQRLLGSTVGGYPVLGNCDWLKEQASLYAVCTIATSKIRKEVIKRLDGVKFASVIDPNVVMSERINIGEGCIICAGSILTVDIDLGSHVIINLDCTVGHDAVINDYVTLYPSVNISGHTVLEECVQIGTGCITIQGLRVGAGAIVGAGSVIIKDIPKECTAVGSPAKPIKFHREK